MKAAKVNQADYVYPEYLMLCKLVKRVKDDEDINEMRQKTGKKQINLDGHNESFQAAE